MADKLTKEEIEERLKEFYKYRRIWSEKKDRFSLFLAGALVGIIGGLWAAVIRNKFLHSPYFIPSLIIISLLASGWIIHQWRKRTYQIRIYSEIIDIHEKAKRDESVILKATPSKKKK